MRRLYVQHYILFLYLVVAPLGLWPLGCPSDADFHVMAQAKSFAAVVVTGTSYLGPLDTVFIGLYFVNSSSRT